MSKRSPLSGHLTSTVMTFCMCAFLLIAFRDGKTDIPCLIMAGAVPAAVWIANRLLPKLFPIDEILFSLTCFLCVLGVVVLYATKPSVAITQLTTCGIGMIAMIICIFLVRSIRFWKAFSLLAVPVSLLLLVLPLLIGRETNGARNWVSLGFVHFQPSEIVKPALIIILSCWMSKHRMIPWLLFSVLCLGILMLQRDLGTALVYFGTTLLLYWASGGSNIGTLVGVAGGIGAGITGYRMFSHVRVRFAIWLNPWADYDGTGYQLVQSLVAIASGGFFGVGLGLGDPTVIPVYESDFIFSVICEQFGVIFGLCVLLVYIALVARGVRVAMAARRSVHGLIAMGCTIMLALQTFVIIGGVIKLIPLTGVTLPFVSYGGTSLISSMCLSGLIQGVASLNRDALEEDAIIARTRGVK